MRAKLHLPEDPASCFKRPPMPRVFERFQVTTASPALAPEEDAERASSARGFAGEGNCIARPAAARARRRRVSEFPSFLKDKTRENRREGSG